MSTLRVTRTRGKKRKKEIKESKERRDTTGKGNDHQRRESFMIPRSLLFCCPASIIFSIDSTFHAGGEGGEEQVLISSS